MDVTPSTQQCYPITLQNFAAFVRNNCTTQHDQIRKRLLSEPITAITNHKTYKKTVLRWRKWTDPHSVDSLRHLEGWGNMMLPHQVPYRVNEIYLINLPHMMTSSNGNIFRVTGPLCGEFNGPGEFPTQRPVTRSFDVFFDLRLNKRLSKQPWDWWFETPSWSLWRQCNADIIHCNSNNPVPHIFLHNLNIVKPERVRTTSMENGRIYNKKIIVNFFLI